MTDVHTTLVPAIILFIKIYLVQTNVDFKVAFQWNHINFTWESSSDYLKAINEGKFIPQNVVPAGVKIYEDRIFLALAKWLEGIPATLTYFSKNTKNRQNIPLIPYPSWGMNNEDNCSNFQNVQSMEIDLDGVMWVIDGLKKINNKNCSCKLILLDLKNNGKIIHIYKFPDSICRKQGGYLNDIVVDDTDGGYAYITDSSSIDPGLIIYSKVKDASWKLRDGTMFASKDAPKFKIDGYNVNMKGAINGIALAPKKGFNLKSRSLFYSVGTGYSLFSISTDILRNETLCKTTEWKKGINLVGKKQGSSGGMMCDNGGDLFYTLQSLNAIGKWNIFRPFETSQVIFQNNETLQWPDSFSMDNKRRDVYILSNHAASFLNPDVNLNFNKVKFRLLKYHNGKRSYICSGYQEQVQCSRLCGEKNIGTVIKV